MIYQALQSLYEHTEHTEGAMVAACVRELGPLSAEELRAMCWPMSSLAAVKHRLTGFVRQGLFVATVDARLGGSRRTSYYHPESPSLGAPNTFADLSRRDAIGLLMALRRSTEGLAASSICLDAGLSRMVLVQRASGALKRSAGIGWLEPAQAADSQPLLLIPDHPTIAMATHRATAPTLVDGLVLLKERGFSPPTVAIIATTPERQRSLHQLWAGFWTGTLSTTRTSLTHHGWLAPIWQTGAESALRQMLLEAEHRIIPLQRPTRETKECW